MKTDSEDQLRSRGIGVLVLGLFGGLWVFLALLERGLATPLYLTALAAVVFAYLATAVWLLRLSRSLPREPEDRARSRAFLRINAISWTSAMGRGGSLVFACRRSGQHHLFRMRTDPLAERHHDCRRCLRRSLDLAAPAPFFESTMSPFPLRHSATGASRPSSLRTRSMIPR